jgi:GntR family transcriptional regulator, transcriptional repressor for pyruvate dehydrogenase complex
MERTMPFRKIRPEKLSTSVIHQIEQLILRGILRPGERLPAERELAEKFGVSRPSLRDALRELEGRDLLTTKPGSGVFVAEVLGSAFSAPLVALFAKHDEALLDYLSFRRDLESLAAERAARLASDTDLKLIDLNFQKMVAANDTRDAKKEAALDAEFHLSIIEASHNVIMLHMMRSMFEMLHMGVFYNRQVMFQQHTTRTNLLDQHRVINAALQGRDPTAAKQAVHAHLDFVKVALQDQLATDHNDTIAQLRLDRQAGE